MLKAGNGHWMPITTLRKVVNLVEILVIRNQFIGYSQPDFQEPI
jgi:hypothetical protein